MSHDETYPVRIADETELTKIVVVGQRSYIIPKDVFEYMDGIHNAALEQARLALKEKITQGAAFAECVEATLDSLKR